VEVDGKISDHSPTIELKVTDIIIAVVLTTPNKINSSRVIFIKAAGLRRLTVWYKCSIFSKALSVTDAHESVRSIVAANLVRPIRVFLVIVGQVNVTDPSLIAIHSVEQNSVREGDFQETMHTY
jgi:hypothetical protein